MDFHGVFFFKSKIYLSLYLTLVDVFTDFFSYIVTLFGTLILKKNSI